MKINVYICLSFENDILKDCSGECIFTIGIVQFPDESVSKIANKTIVQASSATPSLNEEDDFKRETVKPLY